MDRRAFIVGGVVTLVAPRSAAGQPAGKTARIGVLVPAEPASPTEPNVGAFRHGLRDPGYVDGRNISVEYRYVHSDADLFPKLVDELVRLNVDVMVVASGAPAFAAKKATQTIPIVFIGTAILSKLG